MLSLLFLKDPHHFAQYCESKLKSIHIFFLQESKKKVLFISLNYRSSLRFHLKFKSRVFCLLELPKPDI